jgi:protein required for attachment to host cells
MSIRKGYWVVVADGAQARIFHRDKKFSPLHQLYHLSHAHESTHIHGPDKPGRAFESSSPHKHAYEPKTDWHDHQKEIFMDEVALKILEAYRSHAFEKIYLVCPASLINLLKAKISTKVFDSNSKVPESHITCVTKDLTHLPKDEIHDHLAQVEE